MFCCTAQGKAKAKAKHKHHVVRHSPVAILATPHYSSVVMEYPSRTILSSENPTTVDQPASLTKVMTLYLVFQALDSGKLKLNQPIPISAHAASRQPSKLGLKAGDTITVEQAICGLVTKSANDAASVLGEALGGTEDQFAVLMTEQAQKLGMVNTTFKNASGIANSQQLTTAIDMAMLGAAMLQTYPHYYHYFSLREFTYKKIVFKNHNHLLGKYDGCDGIKTGYTVPSGFNLLSSASRGGHRLIAVVLGGSSIKSRDQKSMAILDEGFNKLAQNPTVINQAVNQNLAPAPNPPTFEPTAAKPGEENKIPQLDPPNTIIEQEY
jgi:D-alanyl-D-alanine carboxypeptidase